MPSTSVPAVVVAVHYDFASVMCFFAHRVMQQIEAELGRRGVELRWREVDLTLLVGRARESRLTAEQRSALCQSAERFDLEVVLPARWMDSRPALAVAAGIEEERECERWREAVFAAVYEEGEALDDPLLLDRLSRSLGQDPPEPDDPRLERVRRATAAAARLGVVGVPSFQLGQWPVGGIQDPDTMLEFLTRFARRQRAAPIH